MRNLIWISLDTLRADRLGCYGYERATSPSLDKMAAEGVLFDDANATAPWTMPSHGSLFTGTYPQRHGVIGFETALAPDVGHVATLLANEGFQTFAVVANSALTLHGLERGFGDFEYGTRGLGPEPSDVTPRAIARFRSLDHGRRFFAFLNYNDVHSRYRAMARYVDEFVGPYEGKAIGRAAQFLAHATGFRRLTEEDVRHMSELYDACIRQLDDQLKLLFDYLREQGLLEDTLLVITSDHGEEFWDHGDVNHAMTQYQELVRVPLLLRGPGLPAGRRVEQTVSLLDVLPTSFGVLGLDWPEGLDGVDLRGTWVPGGSPLAERYLYFSADCAPPIDLKGVLRPGFKRAIRKGRFKLHYDVARGTTALFDLEADPTERHDIRAERPQIASEMLEVLQAFLAHAPRELLDAPLSDEELRRLQDLGYVMGGD